MQVVSWITPNSKRLFIYFIATAVNLYETLGGNCPAAQFRTGRAKTTAQKTRQIFYLSPESIMKRGISRSSTSSIPFVAFS